MEGKIIDASVVEQYREKYQAGEMTQIEIRKITGISTNAFARHIKNNNWDSALAFQNRKQLNRLEYYRKIEQYKNDYESALTTITNISETLKIKYIIVSEYIKQQNWNMEANRQKKIDVATSNLRPLTAEAMQKAHIANKKRWERLHKFTQNLKKNDIVYIGGIAFVWGGFKCFKPTLHRAHLIYSYYTYSDTQISKLERH